MTLVSLFCCCEVGVGELDVNVACGVSFASGVQFALVMMIMAASEATKVVV